MDQSEKKSNKDVCSIANSVLPNSPKIRLTGFEVIDEEKKLLVTTEDIMNADPPVESIYDIKKLIFKNHRTDISQQMICIDKILFPDTIQLEDLKMGTSSMPLSTICSKK